MASERHLEIFVGIKLKPCPFCGGDAEMYLGKYQGLNTFYVSCWGCGARTDYEYAEEFAADLWNGRINDEVGE